MTQADRAARRLFAAVEQSSKNQGSLFLSAKSEDVVVGIDASLSNFGISAYGMESGKYQTLLFRPKDRGVRRLEEIYRFVLRVVEGVDLSFRVKHITLEQYAMGIRGGKTFSIGEGGGAVKLALLHLFGADDKLAYPTLVSPTALKKYVTGSGASKKNQMMLAVYRKWEVDFSSSDDMADAYALARLAAAVVSEQTEHKYEGEVVTQLERHTEWQNS